MSIIKDNIDYDKQMKKEIQFILLSFSHQKGEPLLNKENSPKTLSTGQKSTESLFN